MDNITIEKVCQQFSLLKFAFCGVWSADNLPRLKVSNKIRFKVVNTSPRNLPGTHWILVISFPLLFRTNTHIRHRFSNIVIWNSLDISLSYFDILHSRINELYSDKCLYEVFSIVSSPPIQSNSSNLCGLYCIYTALELIANSHYFEQNKTYNISRKMETPKELKVKILKIVKTVGRMNEINLIRYFNSKLKSRYLFCIL